MVKIEFDIDMSPIINYAREYMNRKSHKYNLKCNIDRLVVEIAKKEMEQHIEINEEEVIEALKKAAKEIINENKQLHDKIIKLKA